MFPFKSSAADMFRDVKSHVSPFARDAFSDAYVRNKVSDTPFVSLHPSYVRWMEHKKNHNLDVLRFGLDLIDNTEELRILPEAVKNDFADALLLHDYSRAFQIDPFTGNDMLPNHGADAACRLFKQGHTSPYLLIPILVHDNLRIEMLDFSSDQIRDHLKYSPSDTFETAREILIRYHRLPLSEQDAVIKGAWLVKDADKMANLLALPHWMPMELSWTTPHTVLSKEMVYSLLYSSDIVSRKYCKSAFDHGPHLLSWIYGLYYDYSLKTALDENLPNSIYHVVVAETKKTYKRAIPPRDIAFLKRLMVLSSKRLNRHFTGRNKLVLDACPRLFSKIDTFADFAMAKAA